MSGRGHAEGNERARIEAEAAELETRQRQLRMALSEFRHEARRVRDGLERAGGRARELEQKAQALAANIEHTRRDLEDTTAALEALRLRLLELAPPAAQERAKGRCQ